MAKSIQISSETGNFRSLSLNFSSVLCDIFTNLTAAFLFPAGFLSNPKLQSLCKIFH